VNICLPVERLNGFESEIFPNLRAAPALLIIDSDNGAMTGIDTTAGVCGAIPADIDALVFSGGIGRGMFNGLQQHGIRVFTTEAITVGEALAQLAAGKLEEVGEVASCSGGQQHHHHADAASQCGCAGHDAKRSEHGHGSHGCGCQH